MPIKAFCRYILAAVICFSIISPCSVGEAFCFTSHNNADMSGIAHEVHSHCGDWHLLSSHECHTVECCQNSTKCSVDCAQIFVLPDDIRSAQSLGNVALSPEIAIGCSLFSEKNYLISLHGPEASAIILRG